MSLKSNLLAGAAVGAAILVAGPAAAQTAAPSQAQIDALSQQIQALQSQLTSLKDTVAKDAATTKKTLDSMPRVTANGGRIRVQTADKKFDAAIRGRFHVDYGAFNGGKNYTADATDGFQVRRARLGVAGTVFTDWSYEFTGDFATNRGGASTLQAANIAYNGFKGWSVIVGVQKPKFALEDSTSSNDIPFMERAPVVNIATSIGGSDSRTGVGITNKGSSHFIGAYVTGERTGSTGSIDDQVNLLGRAAFTFWSANEGAAGIGVSGAYQVSPTATARTAGIVNTTSISFGDRPGARIGAARTSLTSTGAINQIDNAYVYGADLGFNFKSLWAGAEYYEFGANTDDRLANGAVNPFNDPSFSGYSLSLGYILTGERRAYSNGEWKGVNPAWPVGSNGAGAWEVATRFSQVDLIDRAGGVAGGGAGKETNWTFGVNWYANSAIRFMVNHVINQTERPNGTKVDLDITAARVQFQF